MTQEVLSGLLGGSVDWLSKLARGVIELDRLSTIVAIADALGIEPVKLLPAAITDAMFRDNRSPAQVPTMRIAGHRPAVARSL